MIQDSRFAFYLIPPYQISRQVAEIHSLLRKQYGLVAAGQFQVHCTIKGFFKKNDQPVEGLIEELNAFLKMQKPIEVELNECKGGEISITLDLNKRNGAVNQELLAFRERVVEIVRPYIAPDCDFVDSDLGPPFRGHITLAMRDIPKALQLQVIAWLEDDPLPQGPFTADTFHFLEFFSEDWAGVWWDTLAWKLHRSWRLSGD